MMEPISAHSWNGKPAGILELTETPLKDDADLGVGGLDGVTFLKVDRRTSFCSIFRTQKTPLLMEMALAI